MPATEASSYSVEVIQRSREIAQLRDQKARTDRLLESAQLRNQRLVEKATETDGIVTRQSNEIRGLNHRIVDLEQRLNESHVRQHEFLQRAAELDGEAARRVCEISCLFHRISELESQLALRSTELEEIRRGRAGPQGRTPKARGALSEVQDSIPLSSKRAEEGATGWDRPFCLEGLEQQFLDCRSLDDIPPRGTPERLLGPASPAAAAGGPACHPMLIEDGVALIDGRAFQVCSVGVPRRDDPAEAFYIGDEDSTQTLLDMQQKVLQEFQEGATGTTGNAVRRGFAPGAAPGASPCQGQGRVEGGGGGDQLQQGGGAVAPPEPGAEFGDLIAAFCVKNPVLGSKLQVAADGTVLA